MVDYILLSLGILTPFNLISGYLRRFLSRFLLVLSGVEIEVTTENSSSSTIRDCFDASCSILTFSHSSNLDGFLVSGTCPIPHYAIAKKMNINNVTFLNIGGISNETFIDENHKLSAKDLGPGNCMIDFWIRQKTKKNYDINGDIARKGKISKIQLDQSLDIFFNNNLFQKKSYDINDFDISPFRGLTLEDGAATITEYTIEILANKISSKNIICCGGGRKNNYLIERLEKKINKKILKIDEFKMDGDFTESQAFAFLAIRSLLNLPISFPMTTGCSKDSIGGIITANF